MPFGPTGLLPHSPQANAFLFFGTKVSKHLVRELLQMLVHFAWLSLFSFVFRFPVWGRKQAYNFQKAHFFEFVIELQKPQTSGSTPPSPNIDVSLLNDSKNLDHTKIDQGYIILVIVT